MMVGGCGRWSSVVTHDDRSKIMNSSAFSCGDSVLLTHPLGKGTAGAGGSTGRAQGLVEAAETAIGLGVSGMGVFARALRRLAAQRGAGRRRHVGESTGADGGQQRRA